MRTSQTQLHRFTNAARRSETDVIAQMRAIFFPDGECETDAPLVDVQDEGLCVAWATARLGLIVRCHDWPDLDRVLALLEQPVYDVVHMVDPVRPLDVVLADFDWWNAPRAFNNGYSLYVFRRGSQRHVRRGSQRPVKRHLEGAQSAHRDPRPVGAELEHLLSTPRRTDP